VFVRQSEKHEFIEGTLSIMQEKKKVKCISVACAAPQAFVTHFVAVIISESK
jgi:hypothetical protein